MKKLMNIFLLSCRRATELIEKNLLVGLNKREKTQLYLHTSMCKACKKYGEHSQEIDVLIKNNTHNHPKSKDEKINSSNLKGQIINLLDKI